MQGVTAAAFEYHVDPIQQSVVLHEPVLHTSVPLHTVPSGLGDQPLGSSVMSHRWHEFEPFTVPFEYQLPPM